MNYPVLISALGFLYIYNTLLVYINFVYQINVCQSFISTNADAARYSFLRIWISKRNFVNTGRMMSKLLITRDFEEQNSELCKDFPFREESCMIKALNNLLHNIASPMVVFWIWKRRKKGHKLPDKKEINKYHFDIVSHTAILLTRNNNEQRVYRIGYCMQSTSNHRFQ